MSIARYDLTVQDAQGRALSGAQVYFCTQPANTGVFPPTPLATIYSDTSGDPLSQPVITDGFGHADAYLTTGVLYTVVVSHPLFQSPMVYTDQQPAGSGSSASVTPVWASTNNGSITGSIPGSSFILPSTPISGSLVLAKNGLVLTLFLGYTLAGPNITLAEPMVSTDIGLNANYLVPS